MASGACLASACPCEKSQGAVQTAQMQAIDLAGQASEAAAHGANDWVERATAVDPGPQAAWQQAGPSPGVRNETALERRFCAQATASSAQNRRAPLLLLGHSAKPVGLFSCRCRPFCQSASLLLLVSLPLLSLTLAASSFETCRLRFSACARNHGVDFLRGLFTATATFPNREHTLYRPNCFPRRT